MQQRMQEQQEARRATAVAPEMGSGPERHRTSEGEEVEVNSVRARQGVTGHNVRFVLGFGVAAIVVAFFIAYLVTSGVI
jgi:hypothetical protein